jgi:hypothetical protein
MQSTRSLGMSVHLGRKQLDRGKHPRVPSSQAMRFWNETMTRAEAM